MEPSTSQARTTAESTLRPSRRRVSTLFALARWILSLRPFQSDLFTKTLSCFTVGELEADQDVATMKKPQRVTLIIRHLVRSPLLLFPPLLPTLCERPDPQNMKNDVLYFLHCRRTGGSSKEWRTVRVDIGPSLSRPLRPRLVLTLFSWLSNRVSALGKKKLAEERKRVSGDSETLVDVKDEARLPSDLSPPCPYR